MSGSPLHEPAFQAVKAGDISGLLTLLTQHPTTLNAINTDGVSLLMFALYNKKKDLADLLVNRGVILDVFSASAYGALEKIEDILKDNPGLVNSFSPDGWTPLHLASFFGNARVVEYLVMSHADINAISRNDLKNQPLHAATVSNKTEVARFLVRNGADISYAQHGGITPLHAAAHNGNEELAQIFLAHGADPNAHDESGETPIDKAKKQGHTHIASILRSQ
jgi:ankyrin repeat protein